VRERQSITTLDGSDVRVAANPIRFGGASGAQASHALGAPPALGADTDLALAAAGFANEEIAALHAAEIVGSAAVSTPPLGSA
jgi:crotonobetainyl-CoA:carnitine CoA-transferase CaiB-like acyl-CoA transferase